MPHKRNLGLVQKKILVSQRGNKINLVAMVGLTIIAACRVQNEIRVTAVCFNFDPRKTCAPPPGREDEESIIGEPSRFGVCWDSYFC